MKAGKWYFRQLFVNGRRAIRARTPNWGDKNAPWWKIRKSTVDRSKPPARDVAITLSVDHPIKAWKNASDVELVFLDNNDGGRRRLGSIERGRADRYDPSAAAVDLADLRVRLEDQHPGGRQGMLPRERPARCWTSPASGTSTGKAACSPIGRGRART